MMGYTVTKRCTQKNTLADWLAWDLAGKMVCYGYIQWNIAGIVINGILGRLPSSEIKHGKGNIMGSYGIALDYMGQKYNQQANMARWKLPNYFSLYEEIIWGMFQLCWIAEGKYGCSSKEMAIEDLTYMLWI